MPDLRVDRLTLHAVDAQEGERILGETPGPGDQWAADYPFRGDLIALAVFLHGGADPADQQPFGYYRITRRADGLAIGGIGFKGPPHEGVVEIGYGLAPSARGHGYAAEATAALLAIAWAHGIRTVVADTTVDNVASQRTLERAGFHLVRSDGESLFFAIDAPDTASGAGAGAPS